MAAALALLATMAAGVGAFAPSRLPSMSSPATRTLHASSYLSSSLGRPSFSLASKQASLLSLSGASRKRTEGLRGAQASSYGVVITGAAGGVGFSYADEFLARGHRVVICDISPKISQAADALRKKHSNAQLFEIITDVSDKNSVSNLASFAKDKLGTINYWINNAGINGGRRAFVEVPVEQVEAVVKVNLLGALLCTQYAMKTMLQQSGVTSHIFNTVGSGVKGGGTPGYVCYGATKRGQPQMTKSLVDELTKGVQGYEKKEYPGDVKVHTLSPGMVFTQLLLDDSTPDLVPKILSTTEQGSSVEFLTTDKILLKLFNRFVLQQKSEYIDDAGNVIKRPGAQYDENGVRALF